MKRCFVILTICLCLLLGGCSGWLDGSYSSVKPHLASPDTNAPASAASNYIQLREALESLVENGRSSGVIATSKFKEDTVKYYMNMAIDYVTKQNPVGAYALESVTYEIGTNAGVPAVAVNLTYTHSRSEILKIRRVDNMEDAINLIYSNLENCTSGVLMMVDTYTDTDFIQMIEDYAETHPQTVMELPQVSASLYPEEGRERVIEISFTYQTGRDDLREMKKKVNPIFTAAALYVQETEDAREKGAQLYAFLMERYENYTIQTSVTPSYSLLMYGVGDSSAFAEVYAAMCTDAGLVCRVVSGTRNGEPWYWNVLSREGVNYHVDLLQCMQMGSYMEMNEAAMGSYVWDYSAYSAAEIQE